MAESRKAVLAEFECEVRIIADPKYQAEVARHTFPTLHAAHRANLRFRVPPPLDGTLAALCWHLPII